MASPQSSSLYLISALKALLAGTCCTQVAVTQPFTAFAFFSPTYFLASQWFSHAVNTFYF